MTANKSNRFARSIFLAMLTVLTVFTAGSCAKKTASSAKTEAAPAENAPIVIPAENIGRVQIKRDVNSNYVIQINLNDLEGSDKIESSSKKYYTVWMNSYSNKASSLGQINSNSGWFADKSKASFEAISKSRPTKIFITEEETASAAKPSAKLVWSTKSF